MATPSQPIGIFDSGLGGLTVAKEILRTLPNECLIYFGDTARVPYGNKSNASILKYSLECAHFLMDQGVKAIVIACNTASAYSLETLQRELSIPVIGVIEPGVRRAASATRNQKVVVLGTEGTIRSGAYQNAFAAAAPEVTIQAVACPLLVPLVEEHFISHPATQLIIQEYLKQVPPSGADTVILGCTHYPLLRDSIQKELGDAVQLIDSAGSCAQSLKEILTDRQLLNPDPSAGESQFYVSDDAERFHRRAREFLERDIPEVRIASVESREQKALV